MSTLSLANIESKAANTPPVIKDVNGTECGQFCRAWVNFNGTGTVAIRASFNVSSITDYGTGHYGMNFTTALADADYATVGTQRGTSIATANGVMGVEISSTDAPTASAVRVWSKGPGGTGVHDATAVCIAIFR